MFDYTLYVCMYVCMFSLYIIASRFPCCPVEFVAILDDDVLFDLLRCSRFYPRWWLEKVGYFSTYFPYTQPHSPPSQQPPVTTVGWMGGAVTMSAWAFALLIVCTAVLSGWLGARVAAVTSQNNSGQQHNLRLKFVGFICFLQIVDFSHSLFSLYMSY